MEDLQRRLEALRRPRLLMRAARHGAEEYRRAQHLPRLLEGLVPPSPAAALAQLLELEAGLERRRAAAEAGYRYAAHVSVLIALLGEHRLWRRGLAEGRGPASLT